MSLEFTWDRLQVRAHYQNAGAGTESPGHEQDQDQDRDRPPTSTDGTGGESGSDGEDPNRVVGPADGGPGRITGFQRDVLLAISDLQRDPRETCTPGALKAHLESRYHVDLGSEGNRHALDAALNDLLDRGAIKETHTIELTDLASSILQRSMSRDAQRIGLHFDLDGELRLPPEAGGPYTRADTEGSE